MNCKYIREQTKLVSNSYTRGFTLIELLIVVLIVGVLATVAVPQYQKAVWKSRFAQAKTMTEALADALEVYYLGNGAYTVDLNALDVQFNATPHTECNTEEKRKNADQCTWSTAWGHCDLNASGQVGCAVTRDGKRYLQYKKFLSHHNTTNRTGKTYCIAENVYKGSTPTAEDLNYQICAADTGSPQEAAGPGTPSFQY
ncbi:MAG: prepilin-type N-terminal cleavage/methylation domain-containing protein [Elusimicrobiaceae bacterium]|nr:prepilin-type N-terminal cleavage/methylation domain-containing protein [Elusimicrobiaceae bacterium]